MYGENSSGLSGREKLFDELNQAYKNGNAHKVVLLTGPSGCGKSYVVNKVAVECNKTSHICSYIDYGDSFSSPSRIGTPSKLNSLSVSIGMPLFSVGLGGGTQRDETQYNYIKSLLKKSRNTTFLFCLDGLSTAHSTVKEIVKILLYHCEDLESKLSIRIYFLFTDNHEDFCMGFVPHAEAVTHIELEPYNTDDFLNYLRTKHNNLQFDDEIVENIHEIQKISNGNLALANFLFVDITNQSREYFQALEKVVKNRLVQLKKDGKQQEISETEMEDVILSSALSLQKFTTVEISGVTQRTDNAVATSLDVAKKDAFVDKDFDCFYDFCCPEVKSILAEQGIQKRKERLLCYYKYYTENEQDEYYIRAFYLANYFDSILPQAFALFGLAFASGVSRSDIDLIAKVDSAMRKYGNSEQIAQFETIRSFYEQLSETDKSVDHKTLNASYQKLSRESFEAPLKAELARSYFCYLYRTRPYFDETLKEIYYECLPYVDKEIALTDFRNSIGFETNDETIVRLNILYTIAPYILDVLNDVQSFTRLHQLSKEMSRRCRSKSARGLAQYIENVFNRKAFLFVNQMQCGPYYDAARAYFSKNEIWDEMCLTLVCQAGTDIVIQKYDDAIACCKEATKIADQNGITLPQPEKLQNNFLIASFLKAEAETKNERICIGKAKETINQLKKLLHKSQRTAEYVILTNLCSLCLYCGDDTGYLKYKKDLQNQMQCTDVSDVKDTDIDDFYRYYFAWFEAFRMLRDENWDQAEQVYQNIKGFVPALFQKQEVFWNLKEQALEKLITNHTSPSSYEFCHSLVCVGRRENTLSKFFFRGLMLSDLQYTSYN